MCLAGQGIRGTHVIGGCLAEIALIGVVGLPLGRRVRLVERSGLVDHGGAKASETGGSDRGGGR